MERQRGFTLLEVVVVIATISGILLATAGTSGIRLPRAHPAQLALQAALVEARALAASTGNVTDTVVATGATVTVDRDPLDASGYGSIIRVYRSRPIAYGGPGATTATPGRLERDIGFPTARVGATFRLTDSGVVGSTERPFTILISNAGYASLLRGYVYDPIANNWYRSADPGCSDGRVTIGADDGLRQESAPFSCRDGVLDLTAASYAS